MSKKIVVMQDGNKECGCACLLSIIRYYQGNVSINYLLELTKTNKEGTNFYNLSIACKELGLLAKGYKIDNIRDYDISKPIITQMIVNNYSHFVVVYKIKNNKITIMDPAKGLIKLSLDEYNQFFTGNILLVEPIKKMPIYNINNYLLEIIKNIIYNNKNIIIKLIFLTLIATIFTCLYSYHFKIIIDNIIDSNQMNLLIASVIFIMILSINKALVFLRNNMLLYLNQKLDLSIMSVTINKIISLPYSYYKNKTTGEIISRVNDLFYIKNVISKIIVTLFLDMTLVLLVIIILFRINMHMSILLLLITIVYLFIFLVYKSSIKNITTEIQDNNARVNSLLVESISSYETIKGLNLEESFKNKINKQYLKTINNNLLLTRLSNSENFLKDLFEGIIIIFVIYLGTMRVIDGDLSIGSLITYNTLLYYYLNPIKNLLDFYQEFYYVKTSIKNINNILNYKYESIDKESNLYIDGTININHLSFSYNYHDKILNDISINIPKGSKVLLLGQTGSGKSTLLKLIYRYYEVKRNMITLGENDILDYTLKDLRSNITYVSQNELLFNDTIRNNIILDREVIDSEFLDICKKTYVNEIVCNKMLSYDYQVEESGANLSGGQRQRIILARSLLKKSKIILIDEGLNEIDINLERKILKNIFYKYYDKTFIIISHRMDNIDLYDMVVNMENGCIKDVIKYE